MPTSGRTRNWRLEIAAWVAAIALVTAVLVFSGGSDDETAPPAEPTKPPAEAPAHLP
jgi:hypothetical protein